MGVAIEGARWLSSRPRSRGGRRLVVIALFVAIALASLFVVHAVLATADRLVVDPTIHNSDGVEAGT
jgi:hypothetical protein